MRERGRYQLQFMKTRSSSGVGTKIDLKFVPETLRIEDLDEGDEDTDTMVAGSLINSLKRSSSIKDEISPDHTEESGDIIAQGSMLKDFLKKKS